MEITDRDICVVAGPGSGKTRVLVERFSNLVTEHKTPINEILTLTFTEKAANEMKIRAASLFEQKGMEKERQEIEFAYLSTIHSFCARLLRENAIEAGINPQFRVMDELEAGRLKEQTLEDTLKKWAEEKSLDTFLNEIFWKQTDSKKSRLKSFKENLILLYEKIRNACVPISETVNTKDLSFNIINSHNEIEKLINEISEIRSEKKLPDKTSEKVECVLEQWNASNLQNNIDELYKGKEKHCPFSPPSRPAKPFGRAQGGSKNFHSVTSPSSPPSEGGERGKVKSNGILPNIKQPSKMDNFTLSLLNKVKGIHSVINLTVSKDVKQPLGALREGLKTLIGLLAEDYSTSIKMMLRDFLVNFNIAYSERKKAESLIDFTDLEVKTIELLENKKYIADEIKQKFKYILVDEFQDISRLQKTIIDLIRSKNNLFIVGDEKQSIYGFRNADVEIFQDIQKDADPESLISLNENFRSRPQILDFINHIFDGLWSDNSTSQDKECNEKKDASNRSITSEYPLDSTSTLSPPSQGGDEGVVVNPSTNSTQQLKAGAEFSNKSLPSIEIIVAEGKDKTQARKWESMEIAKRIKEIVEKGEIKITNKKEQERNISYRDFAILFRSTTDIKLYEHSLSHLDVPYYVISGRGFFNTTEITDLINLLKVIESPLDEINLAAVLKSPFVGIDDDALFWMTDYAHNNKENRLLYQALDEVDAIKEIEAQSRDKIIQFAQFLNGVQGIKSRTSLWNLISFILKKTEFQSKMLLFSNGKRRYANLLKIVELCKNQEDFEPLTLRDFIEIVEGYKFKEIRESEAPVESEEDDVVKLITVHSAKGLEFPVAIVADTDRDNTRPSDYFVYSKNHGISFKILNPSTNEAEEPLSYERINDEIKEKELRESRRLLFVAMTRAQEHLIISGGINKSRTKGDKDNGNWYSYVSSSLGLNPDPKENPEIIRLNDNKRGQNSSQAVEIRHTCIKEENKPLARPVRTAYPGGHGSGGPREGKRIKLLTQYKNEIATCNKIKTPLPSKEITATGKNILSTFRHVVPTDHSHYVYSVTEILKFHFCPQLYYFNSILGLQGINERCWIETDYVETEDENKLNDDEIPGHELGNIVHRVFKKYHFSEDKLKEYIKKELSVFGLDTNQKNIDLITNWVNSFYNSDVGKEVVSSKLYKRETSFIFNYRHNLIRGQIDLFYFNDEGLLKIIDYKANDITINEIPEKVKYYQLQMQLYARALETIYEKKVDETILYFLVPNKSVVIDTTEEACKELDSTLNNFFTAHKDGDFKKLSDHKCKWCEYEAICK
ncbi:MAG: helicase [Candidatus Scalindua rubra]|uniref:DNA 3'-5' helicase n=1 Tax=Candidatus Scalindua rubra TaxID=1872076 RepID=A0A1E3XEF0_9BACT|nr:MAG: helicase [Candidatus Scalindua rubra]